MPYAYGAETTLTRAATPFNAYTRLIAPIKSAGALSVRFDSDVLAAEQLGLDERRPALGESGRCGVAVAEVEGGLDARDHLEEVLEEELLTGPAGDGIVELARDFVCVVSHERGEVAGA